MRIKRTIKYFEDESKTITSMFLVHYLYKDDQVRAGFEKGTLNKATFELKNGNTIIYERDDAE